jgi:hypothetical protein
MPSHCGFRIRGRAGSLHGILKLDHVSRSEPDAMHRLQTRTQGLRLSDGPSAHLSWDELACHDGTPYPEVWRLDRAPELAKAFERVRDLCGFPLIVDSAFRTVAYNASIGGAKASQHCEGRALDLRPSILLHGAAEQARGEGFLRGIGIYPSFVHVDTRPGQNATWYGSRTSNQP